LYSGPNNLSNIGATQEQNIVATGILYGCGRLRMPKRKNAREFPASVILQAHNTELRLELRPVAASSDERKQSAKRPSPQPESRLFGRFAEL
jgi:hypothetical protein